MIKLLVFDLDGTLIDSAQDIATAANRTLAEYGRPALSFELIKAHIGEGIRPMLKGLFPNANAHEQDELIERFLQNYEKDMFNTTSVYPDAIEMLKSWSDAGGLLAIITNKNVAPAIKLVEHLELRKLPWLRIYGADSLPEKKPSALPLNSVMAAAQVTAKETLMIGDGTPDMASAKNAGVHAIGLEFGYTAPEILMRYQPAAMAKNYKDLKRIVTSMSRLS